MGRAGFLLLNLLALTASFCGNFAQMSKIVGIDLGTTNSLVATVDSESILGHAAAVADVREKPGKKLETALTAKS